MTSDKLQQLFKMLEREPADAFLLYGVGMEYKKLGEAEKSIEFFGKAIAADANYCYAYYQRGQMQESIDQVDAAKATYQAGIEAAVRANDAHAKSELEAALEIIR